jgi:hypothetical protein
MTEPPTLEILSAWVISFPTGDQTGPVEVTFNIANPSSLSDLTLKCSIDGGGEQPIWDASTGSPTLQLGPALFGQDLSSGEVHTASFVLEGGNERSAPANLWYAVDASAGPAPTLSVVSGPPLVVPSTGAANPLAVSLAVGAPTSGGLFVSYRVGTSGGWTAAPAGTGTVPIAIPPQALSNFREPGSEYTIAFRADNAADFAEAQASFRVNRAPVIALVTPWEIPIAPGATAFPRIRFWISDGDAADNLSLELSFDGVSWTPAGAVDRGEDVPVLLPASLFSGQFGLGPHTVAFRLHDGVEASTNVSVTYNVGSAVIPLATATARAVSSGGGGGGGGPNGDGESSESGNSDGLSGGAIAGIVIGVLVGVAALAVGGFFVWKKVAAPDGSSSEEKAPAAV